MTLQVAGFLEHSTVNGSGFRSVLFLSGCPHHCPGCHNEAMQSYEYGEKVETDEIISRILKNKPILDGVTFSGGEPFEQSTGLISVARAVKANGLSVWCYTGYLYETLIRDENKKNLLSYIDVLVDGPFIQELKDEKLKYRGSSNQHIYTLKNGIITGTLY